MTKTIVGFDEAGRGPLAGPVCAAAVILPPDFPVEILNDSKKLSEKKRAAAACFYIQFCRICKLLCLQFEFWNRYCKRDIFHILFYCCFIIAA